MNLIPSVNKIVYVSPPSTKLCILYPLHQQNYVSKYPSLSTKLCILYLLSTKLNYVSCIPFLDKIVSYIHFVNKVVYLITFSPIKLCLQYCFCQQTFFHNFMFEILIFFFYNLFSDFFYNCLFVFQFSIDKSFFYVLNNHQVQ